MNATISQNEIAIRRETVHHHWQKACIFIDLPYGWDTLKPLTHKVLEYKGRKFTFLAWNSDRNEAWFLETDQVATIKSK